MFRSHHVPRPVPIRRLLLPAFLLGACAPLSGRTDPNASEVEGVSFRVDARPDSLAAMVYVRNDAPDEVRVTSVTYSPSDRPRSDERVVVWGRLLAPGVADSLRLDVDPRWPPSRLSVQVQWEKVLRTRVPRERDSGPPSSVVAGPPVDQPVPR